jgi:AcrR family transcriptional regulator
MRENLRGVSKKLRIGIMPNKPKAPARQKDRSHTEALLLNAAAKIFSEVGYESATTRMIAQEAGINISLINRYFDGKYGLLLAVVVSKAKKDRNTPIYPMEATFLAEIKHYGAFIVGKYFEELDLFRICLGQFLVDREFLKKFREIFSRPCIDPEFKRRLVELSKKDKIQLNTSLEKLNEDLEIQMFGLTINSILNGTSEKDALAALDEFIKNYLSGAMK